MRPEHVNNIIVTSDYIKELESEIQALNNTVNIERMRTEAVMATIYELSQKLVQHNYGSEYPNETITKLKEHYNNWYYKKTFKGS